MSKAAFSVHNQIISFSEVINGTKSYIWSVVSPKKQCDLFCSFFLFSASPQFLKKPANIYAHEATDIIFECEVTGSPAPTIKWVKNGDAVIPSDYFKIIVSCQLALLEWGNACWPFCHKNGDTEIVHYNSECRWIFLLDDSNVLVCLFIEGAELAGAGTGQVRWRFLSVFSWEWRW